MLLIGKLLAWAGMLDGMHVTWFPSYGAEMRGGTANCTVVISEERFEKRVNPHGIIVLNSSLIKKEGCREDLEVLKVPANEIAEKVGDVRTANMVMVGALISKKRVSTLKVVKEALKKVIPEHKKSLLSLNERALEAGYFYIPS